MHGAVLDDGAVVMVGKSAASGAQTAGFITRWRAPDGPAMGVIVDGSNAVIEQTINLGGDSALLQVAAADGVVLAVGFQADSEATPAHGVVVAMDATTLEVRARMQVDAPEAAQSAALESALVTPEGQVIVGGSWGASRDALDGFKSYGNVVGGQGLVMSFSLAEFLASEAVDTPTTPDALSAVARTIPETFSVKSIRRTSDGSTVAVGSDLEERSGVLWIDPGLTNHSWTPYAESIELTDVVAVPRPGENDAVAVVGHGGPDTIDGHAALVDASGQVLWARAFGNPSVDAEEVPPNGLAPDKFIFDECWGVDLRDDQIVVACGSGIEGCDAVSATESEVSLCQTDPRRSWRSHLVGLNADGEVLWSRSDSFVDADGEAAESAAEFVVVDAQSNIFAIIDQNFGVGLAAFSN